MIRICTYWSICTLILVCFTIDVRAQVDDFDKTTQSVPSQNAAPKIRESLPSLIYTTDEEGKPTIPWVDIPMEDLDEMLQRRKREQVKVVIRELKLDVTAEDNRAVVRNTLKLQTLTDGIQVVPIKMGSVAFKSEPESSEAKVYARAIPNFNEYELVVDAQKGTEVTVKFETITKLTRIGGETHLRMSLPRVPNSALRLKVPIADATASIESGSGVSTTDESNSTEGETVFDFIGLAPDLRIVWHQKSKRIASEKISFEVEGNIEVEVDALGSITTDALLSATSFNKPIETLLVRLPENTRLADADGDFGNYRVTPIEGEGPRREVQIVFDLPSTKPTPVLLRVKSEKELSEFELAGFEVLAIVGESEPIKANSESGVVTVYSEGSRRLHMMPGDFAQRVSSTDKSTEATYEYSRPNQIRLAISRQSTELFVQPTYIVELDETRATLTAFYQCSKRGGNVSDLTFDMGDWSFQSLHRDPDSVVVIRDEEDFVENEDGLELPLRNTPDQFAVSITAWIQLPDSLDHTAKKLAFDFPVPKNAQQIQQSTVAIITPPNVVAASAGSSGYTEINPTDLVRSFAAERGLDSPSCFRMASIGNPKTFALAASKLNRKTIVDCDIEITDVELLDEQTIQLTVRELMKWRVRDVAMDHAYLRMDKRIYQNEDGEPNLRVSVDGKSRLEQKFERSPEFADTDAYTVRVTLDPQIASFDMVLEYDWIYESPGAKQLYESLGLDFDLALALPKRESGTSTELEIRSQFKKPRVPGSEIGLSIKQNAAIYWPWKGPSDVANADPEIEAIVDPSEKTMPNVLPINLKRAEESQSQTEFEELVDRAWFQTWLTHDTRTDRAVFRVKGGDERLRIAMPKSNFQRLYVYVDGSRVIYERDGENIELTVDANATSHVIELRYHVDSRSPPGLLKTEVPEIEGTDILGQWYWHIVMPRNECMITWPRSLTRAHQWDWSSAIPRHKPQLSLEELEEWSGAAITGEKVLFGSTEYLFGAMGETRELSVRTTLFPIYVIVISGSIFLFGLLLLYYERRAIVVFVVGVLISCLIFLHPSIASISGQVAVFGALLVFAMSFLRWLVHQIGRPNLKVTEDLSNYPTGNGKHGSSVIGLGTTTLAHGSSRLTGGKTQ